MRIHAISGVLALVSIHAACLAPPKEPEIAAFLTSQRVVYPFGSPIDLTFSIAVPQEGSVSPDFKIEREAGSGDEDGKPGLPETIEPREVAGRFFWETPGKAIDGTERPGSIPAGRQHTETITDLRRWYDLDAPGTYRITFDGQWLVSPRPRGEGPTPGAGARAPRKGEVESHPVTSNTLTIRIARPASEEEPLGEPIEGHVIPLEDIWALDMPGTRPMNPGMRSVDPQVFNAPEGKFLYDLIVLHGSNEEMRSPAREGFIVRGSGMDALRQAHAVLVEKQEPSKTFRRGEEVTLVFFTKSISRPVHIRHVDDHGALVTISYELVPPHMGLAQPMNSTHLALIPLRLDHTGIVRIEIKPINQDDVRKVEWANHIRKRVAQSFQIQVIE